MGLAERTLAQMPSAREKLIVQCTYNRARYVPARDKGRPVVANFARAMAAHLLKTDAGQDAKQIAGHLECTEEKAAEFLRSGEQVASRSGEVQELLMTIRDDVHERLEMLGMELVLQDVAAEPPPPVVLPIPDEVPGIIALIGRILAISPQMITGPTKCHPEMHARHIAVAIVQYKKPGMSRPKIGSYFGKRDNTTILSSLKKIDRIVRGEEDDPVLLRKIEVVREKLGLELGAFYFVEKKTR